jgi:hypothetical protein
MPGLLGMLRSTSGSTGTGGAGEEEDGNGGGSGTSGGGAAGQSFALYLDSTQVGGWHIELHLCLLFCLLLLFRLKTTCDTVGLSGSSHWQHTTCAWQPTPLRPP